VKAKKPDNILLVAITRMGDMLQASPTIAGIKMENPNARVTVLIERNFAAICDGLPGIDEVIVIDLTFVTRCLHREQESLLDAYKYVSDQIDDLRSRKFDCVINMASSPYTAILIKLLGVEKSLGWLSDDEGFRLISNPWAMLFAAYVYHSNRDYNTINLVDILRCSSEVNQHPQRLIYNVPEADKKFAEEVMQFPELQGDGPLIAIQVGASQGKRQWSPKRFAALSRLLIEDLGARLLFTGTRGEQPLIDTVFAEYSSPRMHSVVGKTTIAQLAGLLEHCELLVTGDTGTMHLAVAVGRPVVAVFLASALAYETGPYSHGNLIVQPQIHCNPCNPNYPCSRPDCHDQVPPELVAELVRLRLSVPVGADSELRIDQKIADPN
jgi:ADP-heptose:LPS heptosyltransferase